MTGNFDLLLTAWQDFQIALMVLDTLRMFDDLYSSPISFMLTAVFVLRMQHNMCYVFHSCGTSHCIAWFSFLMTPSSSFCLLPKEVLWPFRFPWYRTQVTKAMEKKKDHTHTLSFIFFPPSRVYTQWHLAQSPRLSLWPLVTGIHPIPSAGSVSDGFPFFLHAFVHS